MPIALSRGRQLLLLVLRDPLGPFLNEQRPLLANF